MLTYRLARRRRPVCSLCVHTGLEHCCRHHKQLCMSAACHSRQICHSSQIQREEPCTHAACASLPASHCGSQATMHVCSMPLETDAARRALYACSQAHTSPGLLSILSPACSLVATAPCAALAVFPAPSSECVESGGRWRRAAGLQSCYCWTGVEAPEVSSSACMIPAGMQPLPCGTGVPMRGLKPGLWAHSSCGGEGPEATRCEGKAVLDALHRAQSIPPEA